MFKNSLYDIIERFHLVARLLPVLLVLTPWSASAGVHELCSNAGRLGLDTTFRGDDGGRVCYRVDVSSPGFLAVEASAPGSPEAEPRLVFLGGDGVAVPHRIVQETPRGVIVELFDGPGAFFVLVGPEDPALPLVGYKLRTAFAPRVATKDVEEDDEDASDIKSLHQGDLDDHGDTPLFATPLELGESVAGMIENPMGDDEDVFTFVVDELRSVRVDATAGHLTLYDGHGQRLWASVESAARPGLVRALSPGRYYLRLQSLQGSGDAYVLRLGTMDEPSWRVWNADQ